MGAPLISLFAALSLLLLALEKKLLGWPCFKTASYPRSNFNDITAAISSRRTFPTINLTHLVLRLVPTHNITVQKTKTAAHVAASQLLKVVHIAAYTLPESTKLMLQVTTPDQTHGLHSGCNVYYERFSPAIFRHTNSRMRHRAQSQNRHPSAAWILV